MFQHLDSGARPPDPSDLRFDVERRACALRQRRRLVATTALSMCLLLPAAIGYVGWRSVQPTRVHVFDELPTSEPATSGTASSALTTATPATPSTTAVDAPVTLLVVGTDRGLAPGGDASTNADTILVVHLDPGGSRRVLAVPRDLKVTDGRSGKEVRLKELLSDRAGLVRAVSSIAGATVDHYIELDTDTFAALIDSVGGVRLSFAAPVRDRYSGFAAAQGCQLVDGQTLRTYVRSRRIETFQDGVWMSDQSAEPGRVLRLDDLAQRVVPRILDLDNVALDKLLGDILPRLTVDDRLSLGEARHVLAVARQLAGVPLTWAVLPTRIVRVDNVDMLEPVPATDGAAAAYLTTGTPLPPTDVLPPSLQPAMPDNAPCGP